MFFLSFVLTSYAQDISSTIQSGEAAFSEIRSLTESINAKLNDAEQSGNSMVIQCVTTKQASATALRDVSQLALVSLKNSSEASIANMELRKITLSLSKVRQYENDAQNCVLTSAVGGEDSTSFDVPTELTIDDTQVVSNFGTADIGAVTTDEGYSFDSASGSAENVSPPPATSPY